MKVLLDMNLSPEWVGFLSGSVSEVVHWSSIGDSAAEDAEIMAYARGRGFIVLTQDLDFGAILAGSGDIAPSVILLRAGRVTPVTLGSQVLAALGALREDLTQGAFITIEPDRTRITILPLKTRLRS